MRTRALILHVLAITVTTSCRPASPSKAAPTELAQQRPYACSHGRTIDSVYIVRTAAEALSESSGMEVLKPSTFEPVVAPGPIEEGVLVRLTPRDGRRVGGDGLVFVDVVSGCAIPLRRYE